MLNRNRDVHAKLWYGLMLSVSFGIIKTFSKLKLIPIIMVNTIKPKFKISLLLYQKQLIFVLKWIMLHWLIGKVD